MERDNFKNMGDVITERNDIAVVVGKVESSVPGEKVGIISRYKGDIEKAIETLSRRNCIPDETIYKDDPNLKNSPVDAALHMSFDPNGQSFLEDSPVEDKLIIGAAKIKSAGENLKLSSEQKENFDGVVENIKGSIPFYSGPAAGVIERVKAEYRLAKGKVAARVAGASMVLQMGLTACNPVKTPEVPTQSPAPIVEQTDIPGFIPASQTPVIEITPQASPSETPTPFEIAGQPYPESSTNFDLENTLSGTAAESRLSELGVGEQVNDMKVWYKENGVKDSQMEVKLYEGPDGTHWDIFIKDANSHYQKIILTSGAEKGQLVRAFGLVNYFASKPTFTFSPLENPDGYPNAIQDIVYDKSSWSVVGAFDNDELVAWFNAEIANGGDWVVESVDTTSTPETINYVDILHNTLYYGTSEIAAFQEIKESVTTINGTEYKTIVGVGENGTETILAAEVPTFENKGEVWARISTYKYGNTDLTFFLNPDWGDGSVQVHNGIPGNTEKGTSQLFFDYMFKFLSMGGQTNVLSQVENANTAGKVSFEVPVAHVQDGTMSQEVDWQKIEWDSTKPVEMVFIQSPDDIVQLGKDYFWLMKQIPATNKMGGWGGGFFTDPEDGHGIFVVYSSSWKESDDWDLIAEQSKTVSLEDAKQAFSNQVQQNILYLLSVFVYKSYGGQAFILTHSLPNGQPREDTVWSVNEDSERILDSITQGIIETYNLTGWK